MPKLTIYPSGFKAAKPPRKLTSRGMRSDVQGWSKDSARRCDLFLRSVDIEALEARNLYGIAATLTLRDCPPTHAEWVKLQRKFFERMTRRNLVLAHFVTEWQPRSRFGGGPVPHLHAILFFPTKQDIYFGKDIVFGETGPGAVTVHWVVSSMKYSTGYDAQHCEEVRGIHGWFRYLAKHAARTVHHYQRDPDLIPEGWEKTGRMWGRRGDWPVKEMSAHLSDCAFYALRRFANRYQLAKARTLVTMSIARLADARGYKQKEDGKRLLAISHKRVVFLRKQLKRNQERIGRIMPVSEWVPSPVVARWLRENCRDIGAVDPETSEVTAYYVLAQEGDEERFC